jgi:HK97 family phage major capsid protein
MATDVIIPTSAEELEEMLNAAVDGKGDERMTAILKDPQLHAKFTREYVKAQLTKNNGELSKQTRDAVQQGMQEFLQDAKEGGNIGLPAVAQEGGYRPYGRLTAAEHVKARRAKLYSKRALGAQLHGEKLAASWGEFMPAIHHKTERTPENQAFRKAIRAAMSERVPSEGGFLVPETLRSQMLMVALEKAIVRSRARTIPMDSLRVPYPTIDDPSHANSVFGGVIGYWTEEAAALQASAPSFGRIVLESKKLTGYTEIPNELLEDSVEALDQFFEEMYPEALAWFEDVAFLSGDGVGQPLGVLNTGATCAVRVPCQTLHTVGLTDIVNMYVRMLPQSLNSAVWICSPDVIAQLLQLVLISGTTPVAPPLWLNQMSIAGEPVYTLLGRPLIVSEKVPTNLSGNTTQPGALTFVDFNYYLIGDRQTMQVSSSDEYKFGNDLTAFRVIERLDGRPWLRSPLTQANGSTNTLSPIVKLDTTATS